MAYSKHSGFTLVELAIVLMIIGLLIGGILKGQELIQNARITSFVTQTKSFSAAMITFQDSYGALPGDITNPGTRLPNCTATAMCNTAGNGNGVIGGFGVENYNSVNHLGQANLVSGIDNSTTLNSTKTPLGGYIFFNTRSTTNDGTAVPRAHYINYYIDPDNIVGDFITAPQAARIDRKMDDGIPATGSVISTNGYDLDFNPGTCLSGTNYAEGTSVTLCNILIAL